jgi:hypothetical protein
MAKVPFILPMSQTIAEIALSQIALTKEAILQIASIEPERKRKRTENEHEVECHKKLYIRKLKTKFEELSVVLKTKTKSRPELLDAAIEYIKDCNSHMCRGNLPVQAQKPDVFMGAECMPLEPQSEFSSDAESESEGSEIYDKLDWEEYLNFD